MPWRWLHHFANPEKPFQEMKRVLKKGGKLVVWDMEAAEESLRTIDDKIENMRDPSHTRILSRKEFEKLFEKDFELQCEETTLVLVNLNSWLELTDTPEDVQKEITDLMKAELAGGSKQPVCAGKPEGAPRDEVNETVYRFAAGHQHQRQK